MNEVIVDARVWKRFEPYRVGLLLLLLLLLLLTSSIAGRVTGCWGEVCAGGIDGGTAA